MNIAIFLRDTPVWIWILLAFLLRRGFAALYVREMTIRRLFFLPVLFLVWGAYGVITETALAGASLSMMAAGLLAGTALGYRLWRLQPPLRDSDNPGMIIRAGTPLTLGLIVITFCHEVHTYFSHLSATGITVIRKFLYVVWRCNRTY
ncbi:DUF6622 family protein [Escherichia sp. E3356]|uniref:DUF6622 family protein n=1 Tax=Escherichia sp. E3356 TaxID=2044461 RepID=UPI001F0D3C8B|nr:DUF6622 family protein [Escherichia sp. E3356]